MATSRRDAVRAARERLEQLAGDQAGDQPGDPAADQTGDQPSEQGHGSRLALVSDRLYATARLLAREARLRRALSDPSGSTTDKIALLDRLLGGQLDDSELGVLHELVRGRWARAGDLVDEVDELATHAALRVAEAENRLDDVEDELFRFSRLVDREPALRAALTDPAVAADRKAELLRALLEGKAQPTTVRLLVAVITDRRGRQLDRAVEELVRLAADRRRRLVAEVRVASPLTDEQRGRLAEALGRVFGRAVQLQVDVDPGVVGGVAVRVGDDIIDGTIRRRLDDARQRLAG